MKFINDKNCYKCYNNVTEDITQRENNKISVLFYM